MTINDKFRSKDFPSAQIHQFGCYVQFIDQDIVRVRFYKLINIGADQSAPALLAALKYHLEEDGLWEHAKKYLKAFISDGARALLDQNDAICHMG